MIKDHQPRGVVFHHHLNFFHFSATRKGFGIGSLPAPTDCIGDPKARAAGKFTQFSQGALIIRIPKIQRN
jgi:hypothetical protein